MISLILTVLNEGDNLQRLLESIGAQTRLPDEVVIVDGGSSDNTVEVIRQYAESLPLRALVEPGCSISEGRNHAVRAARGNLIAVTDAGVVLDRCWLERLIQPLLNDPDIQVASGFFQAEPHTVFEAAMGATVLPLVDEIDPASFLPSSRSVAFRRSAWEAVGGYPEWLDYCEDLIFDLRLKQLTQNPFAFVPDALVYFRPRRTLRAFFRQYYLYARGDGKADLWRKRHALRYVAYLVAAPLIFALGWALHPLVWALYLPGAAYYLYQPYRRLPRVLKTQPHVTIGGALYAAALVPVIRVVGDVAKMLGYPVGLRWRAKNRPPNWRSFQASNKR